MGKCWYLSAAPALFALNSVPAEAQPMQANARPDGPQAQGSGTFLPQDGFVLYEHGIWPRSVSEKTHRIVAFDHRSEKSPKQTGRTYGKNQKSWRRTIYLPQVLAAEARYSLPTGLLDALVWTESRYNPLAVSTAGAAGLGQLMPGTARALGITNRYDPGTNILGAARYLRQMLDRFGLVHLAVAAYNAGPGAVERAGGIPINGETPGYVRDVLHSWHP